MLIGYCLTGSFCTISQSLEVLRALVKRGDEVLPIVSEHVRTCDTRFATAISVMETVEEITGNAPICDIVASEPLGPKIKCDVMCVAPCTSNTLSKLAHGFADNTVTLAVKAHLRREKPVVLAVCTNDALGASAVNIGEILNRKHYYIAPLYQDDCVNKPRSLVANFDMLINTIDLSVEGRQIQPIFDSPKYSTFKI